MVKEKRIVFEVEDVVKVRLRCGTCNDEVVKRVDDAALGLPTHYPLCNTRWRMNGDSPTHDLLMALPKSVNRENKETVLVSFEMSN